MQQHRKTIIFSGGGTLGPVVPLLAVWDEMHKQNAALQAVWIGTSTGPEQSLVLDSGIEFIAFDSPKLRRYFSFRTLLLPITIPVAIYSAMMLLFTIKPSAVVSAGGYTSLPIHVAAWLMRIPGFVHQQDAQVGLTNKLIAPLAASVTAAFTLTAEAMGEHVTCIGNPVRMDIGGGSIETARKRFDLEPSVPVVLVLGGGTGAQVLNDEIWNALPELTQHAQIIHSAGKGKGKNMQTSRYRQYPFISREDLAHAYAVADVVVVRAGMGTLSEIAALKKAAVLVPIPDSHQELNVVQFVDAGAAVDGSKDMIAQIIALVQSTEQRQKLVGNLKTVLRVDAAHRLAQMIGYGLNKKRK